MHFVSFFPFQSLADQIWLFHKTGEGKPKGIIYTYFVELPPSPPKLHTKFQGNQLSGSGEEDFFKVFTIHIYEHSGNLGNVTWIKYINFFPLLPGYEIYVKMAQNFLRRSPLTMLTDYKQVTLSFGQGHKWPWILEFNCSWIPLLFDIREHNSTRIMHFFRFSHSKA